ncbi:PREDICTED: unknown [Prunus dulcis]|uniref:DUF506 family protein n=1 Tax=Prunus dulcis TaxID=3755 RepID=A0A5E4G0R3_PRUDU|nr:uncharacterized protein LOC117614134 [Prunus dulcis]VVA33425.1 PREDICTED: unknown [Prunus dulcis]
MPFPMKIQPIDVDSEALIEPARVDSAKPVLKSRLRRLFDRQFPSVLRISSAQEKPSSGTEPPQQSFNNSKDGGNAAATTEFEPSSVCLAKMVQNFIEESNEKQPPPKCGRNRCNCFHGNSNDSSDDELDVFGGGFGDSIPSGSFGGDASDILKSLIPCVSVEERNLLAHTANIVEANKNQKQKDDWRKAVTDELNSLGYDSSICKSKWEKSSSFPAGEYEYIDVMVEGDRLLIDIDFRSEFEVARSTGPYKAVLQSLPYIFVGKSDRLGQIVSIVSEAAKQSLKKKGMHFPPWRKAEYMRAKWLSPYTRATAINPQSDAAPVPEVPTVVSDAPTETDNLSDCGELELIFGKSPSLPATPLPSPAENPISGEKEVVKWQPPAIKPKSVERGARIVTGLASLLKEKP